MEYRAMVDNIIDQSITTTELNKAALFDYSKKQKEAFDKLQDETAIKLTALPGLRDFFYQANEMVAAHPDKFFAVIVMDIAQFKAVNEFCGREAGDALLVYISNLYRKLEQDRPLTISSHARADNFLVCTSFERVIELEEIAIDFYEKIRSFPLPYKVLPAFGICPSAESVPAVSFLKDCATIAMNNIKGKFYSKYCIFDEEMRRDILREKQIENDIVNALESNQLKAMIQPKVDMRNGEIIGGEALVRWVHPSLGIISPGDFVPVLENNGFIIQVDYYVWESVFAFLRKLRDAGKPLIPISINISRVHIYDSELYNVLTGLQKKYDIPPKYVPLELTESALLETPDLIFAQMNSLRRSGFLVSMDDFGTGHSSLNMLTQLPIDEVKIDRSFITHLDDPRNITILHSIITMLNQLEFPMIIEGVETDEQRELLIEMGCYHAQGFYFHRPMDIDDFQSKL